MPAFTDAGYIEDYLRLVGVDELQKDETGREFLRLFEEYKATFDNWKKRWPWLPSRDGKQEWERRQVMNKLLHLMECREGECPARVIDRLRNEEKA